MTEEQKYYPTAYKISELKKKGIVPFSKLGQKFLNLSVCLLSVNFILDLMYSKNLSLVKLYESKVNGVTFFSDEVYFGIKSILILGGIISFTSLVGRYFQTEFIFISLTKYPKGILRGSRKFNFGRVVFQLSFGLLFLLTGFSYTLYIIKTTFSLKADSQNLAFLTNLIYFLAGFFLVSSILLIIRAKGRFIEDHKMSKQEILQEIKETEGSQDTKKQMRSQN